MQRARKGKKDSVNSLVDTCFSKSNSSVINVFQERVVLFHIAGIWELSKSFEDSFFWLI